MQRKKRSTRSSPPAKRRRKPTRPPPRWWLPLSWCCVAAGALCFLFFLQIDTQVEKSLSERTQGEIPSILSEVRELTVDALPPVAALTEELLRRRYRRSDAPPRIPGEFQRLGDTQITIYPRAFHSPDGSLIRQEPVAALPSSGELLRVRDQQPIPQLLLEPQILSSLGGEAQRASRHIPLAEMPPFMPKAIVAVEDERFYSHWGVDLQGIGRAIVVNLRAGRVVQGGSTLTQQLAKNLLFSPKRTFTRKFRELFAAVSLERRLSKDEILELYLNEVYLGQEGSIAIHGVAEAAQTFFGKELRQLSLAEGAMLAGLVKAPSAYNPRKHLARAVERRNIVLAEMFEKGMISAAQLDSARRERPRIISVNTYRRGAPHFTAALRRVLTEDFGLEENLLAHTTVHTGIDFEMQRCAERSLTEGLMQLERQHQRTLGQRGTRRGRMLEGGLVAIEPHSGKVRAFAGGRDYSKNQFDHVLLARRQVGSTIKPFVYLTALDGSLNSYRTATAASILADEPMDIELAKNQLWSPDNYDHTFRGDVTLREALEQSLNLPSVYIARRVGLDAVARTVTRFHLGERIPAVPSLALGALDSSLYEMTAAYAALANGGSWVQPRLFLAATDRSGATFAQSSTREERIAGEQPVGILTSILEGAIDRGTGSAVRRLGYTGPVAGKTGTSDSARDAWFIGFTPTLSTGVWVGFDDNSVLGLTGGAAAAPIWTEFMKCIAPVYQAPEFLLPPGIVRREIDAKSGELFTDECPEEQRRQELFIGGTEPQNSCHLHGGTPLRPPTRERQRTPGSAPRNGKTPTFWEQLFG